MADTMEWVWSKDPDPEELLKLPKEVREAGFQTMKRELPNIVRWVVKRIRRRGVIVKNGREATIPPYSEAYERRLKNEGRGTKPDYTYTGRMLDYVRGRVLIDGRDIVGRAGTRGRITSADRVGVGKRKGMVYREPYSYTHSRSGKVVHVEGQWIRKRGISIKRQLEEALKGGAKKRTLVYNAHLMNYLVSRKGRGKWTNARIATHHILALTPGEIQKWTALMQASYSRASAKVLAKTAGK